jgi:hypothetical protein
VAFIRQLIATHPSASRRALSAKLCDAWQWRQANGALRDMVCRGLLLMLHRAGEIELPPVRYTPPNPLVRRTRPPALSIDTTPIHSPLHTMQPVALQQVRRTAEEPLFNSLMESHHYLGYEQPVGEHLKYLVWAQERLLALSGVEFGAMALGEPGPLHRLERKRGGATLASSLTTRAFLILPCLSAAPGLAHPSQPHRPAAVAGLGTRLPALIYFLKPVDPSGFAALVIGRANWVPLGRTTGRGKDDQTGRPNRSIKRGVGLSADAAVSAVTGEDGNMRPPIERMTSPPRNWRPCLSRPGRRWGTTGIRCRRRSARWAT